MPVIEPEAKPRKKALFTARVDPSVVETLRAYCEFLNRAVQKAAPIAVLILLPVTPPCN